MGWQKRILKMRLLEYFLNESTSITNIEDLTDYSLPYIRLRKLASMNTLWLE